MGRRTDVHLPNVWNDATPTDEETEELFAILDKILKEEKEEEEKKKKAKAEKDEAAWKERLDFVEALLKADGITDEVVRVELYELMDDDCNALQIRGYGLGRHQPTIIINMTSHDLIHGDGTYNTSHCPIYRYGTYSTTPRFELPIRDLLFCSTIRYANVEPTQQSMSTDN